jgi:hypothetical protein
MAGATYTGPGPGGLWFTDGVPQPCQAIPGSQVVQHGMVLACVLFVYRPGFELRWVLGPNGGYWDYVQAASDDPVPAPPATPEPPMELESLTVKELRSLCDAADIRHGSLRRKAELIAALEADRKGA